MDLPTLPPDTPPPGPPDTHLQKAFTLLTQAFTELDLHDFDQGSLHEQLCSYRQLVHHTRTLQAFSARCLAAADRTRQRGGDDQQECVEGTARWLADHLQVSHSTGYAQVQAARQLDQHPSVAGALRAGSIGERHVSVICKALRSVQDTNLDAAQVEQDLLQAACSLEPADLHSYWLQKRYQADQQAGIAAERRQRNRLDLTRTQWNDYRIDGVLTAETGSLLRTALAPLMRRRSSDDERSVIQRRGDALGELARRQLNSGSLPEHAGERPHLNVITSLETLRMEPGSPMAELDNGLLITGESVQRLAADAMVTEVTVDEAGRILDLGRRVRTVSPRMRRELNLRDRRCQHPGCQVPATDCIPHHLRPWWAGGRTTLANLRLYCERHHPRLHPENARFRRRDRGPAP